MIIKYFFSKIKVSNTNVFKHSDKISSKDKLNISLNPKDSSNVVVSDNNTNGVGEYGYKIKGPEPTRYGDWEIKGRCFDF